jgi:hypothetical protein
MKSKPKDRKDANQNRLILAGMGVSVVVGMVVGDILMSKDTGKMHLISLTGRGLLADFLVVAMVALAVLAGVGMLSVMRPGALTILGAILTVAPLASPFAVSYLYPHTKIDFQAPTSFLISGSVEFIGAIFLGTGLRRLITQKRKGLPTIDGGQKNQ